MNTEYIPICYKEVRIAVMGSRSSGNVWTENSDANERLFMLYFQLLSDETPTILKSTALALYSEQSMSLNVSARRKK